MNKYLLEGIAFGASLSKVHLSIDHNTNPKICHRSNRQKCLKPALLLLACRGRHQWLQKEVRLCKSQ